MKVCKFFLVSIFIIVLVITILFGVLLTLAGMEMFFDELKLINETLATSIAISLLGLAITVASGFIFKTLILED